MRLYQSTDSDRRQHPTACGANSRMETTYTFNMSGEPYDELTVRITVNGGQVHFEIDTTKCGPGMAIFLDGREVGPEPPAWLVRMINEDAV